MIALRDSDPFPDTELVEYRSVDLLTDELPSPIDPLSRRTRLTFCWLPAEGHQIEFGHQLNSTLHETLTSSKDLYLSSRVDTESAYGTFFILDIEPVAALGMENTDVAVENLTEAALPIVQQIERALAKRFPDNKRATGKYWTYEIGVVL